MEAKDVINLVNAGFSKDDILKMFSETQPQPQPAPEPQPQPQPQPAPEPQPQPQPQPAPEPQPQPANDQTAETIKNLTTQVTTLTEIIKTMQSDAIKNAGGGKPETKTSLAVVKDFFGQPTK